MLPIFFVWVTGRITAYLPSGGPFVRMDSHVYPDYVVPPSYDSLLGKVCHTSPFVRICLSYEMWCMYEQLMPSIVDVHVADV